MSILQEIKAILRRNYFIREAYYRSVRPVLGKNIEFITFRQLTEWTLEWAKTFPQRYDVIVGIPRSGMIVASILACRLGKPLSTPDKIVRGEYWLPTRNKVIQVRNIKNVLLVDDATGRGVSMQNAYDQLKDVFGDKLNITRASLLVEKYAVDKVDLYHKVLDKGYFYEWDLVHGMIRRLGVDMDGVLCEEPSSEVDRNEEKYVQFIANARPHIIPAYTVEAIVTNRLEKYRRLTEEWLERHNVKYKNLVMLDLPSKSMRTPKIMIQNKVDAIRQFDLRWFWESNFTEAQAIHRACRIPVLCIDKMVLFS